MTTPNTADKTRTVLLAFRSELDTYSGQLDRLQAMNTILHQDILDLGKLALEENKTDCNKRAFTRAGFAMIEGNVFNLKQIALKLSEHGKGNFSTAELAMLEEHNFSLKDNGKAEVQIKFIALAPNLRFAFSACARAFGVQHELKVDDEGWQSFQEALRIRNRITHPKSVEDLHLSEKDVDHVEASVRWFLRNKGNLIQKLVDRMQVLSDRFNEAMQQKAPPA
jgi:hypothetical protein